MKSTAKTDMDYPDDEIKQLRRRLAEAEERIAALEDGAERTRFLEAVVQGVAEPILVIDKNYNIVLKNAAADGFWGIQHGGLPKCHEASHGEETPCDRKKWPCPLRDVLETRKPITVTHSHNTAQGLRLHEILASPLFGENGEIEGIIETARDITERKRAEDALARAASRLEFLTNNNPAVLYATEPGGTWGVRFISANVRDILGYQPEEFYGNPAFWFDQIHPDDQEKTISEMEQVSSKEIVKLEYRFRHKDGSWRWMHDEIKLVRDGGGTPVEAMGYWIDVTARRKAEESLKEEYAFRVAIEESINAGVVVIDTEGLIKYTNPAFSRMVGWSAGELAGASPPHPFWPPESAEEIGERLKALLAGEEMPPFEQVFITKSGQRVCTLISVSLLLNAEGKKSGWLASVSDITEFKKAEEEIRKKESQQRAILDSIPDMAWLKDSECRFIAVNDAVARAGGRGKDELSGKTDFDVWPQELAARYIADDREVMASGRRKSVEEPFVGADGETRWLHTIKTPIYDKKGSIIGTAGISRDITENKVAQQMLQESEERFRSVFENSLDAILISSQDGHYYAANPAACGMLGYTEEELTKVGREGISDPSDPNLHKYIEERRTKGGARAELTLIRKDGTKFPAEVSASVFTDREGRQRASVIIRDITRRRQAEEDLRKFKFFLDGAGEEFYIFDGEGKFLYVNEGAVKSLGYSEEELLGMYIRDIDSEQDKKKIAGRIEALRKGDIPVFEVEHRSKEGRLIPKEVKAEYRRIDDIDYFFSFVRDISERKALERQRNDFLAMVTHDLKSPLTAILGYSQLIKERCGEKGDRGTSEMAEAVNQSGERLLRLVEDFLTISKMEAERFELRKAPSDLGGILQKLEKDFYPTASKKGLTFSVELPAEPMQKILMDKAQVERALGNIVQNAINYTPGGGTVTIKAGDAERDGKRYAFVAVSDTGKGIPREEQEKIFSQYYRSVRTAGIRGSGLGLTIAKAVAEAHGGWIELESEPGKGSTFTIFLPE